VPSSNTTLAVEDERNITSRTMHLESAGLTLIGIMLSIAVTVALGVHGRWWTRVVSGLGTIALLLVFFGYVARPGKGPLTRLARWLTRT
jgi:hypothetical protein